ncbi:nucleotidyltransferase [Achromobacter xylosoxidans]
MTQNHPKLSERLIKSLVARNDAHQWEKLMAMLLQRLELSPGERNDAKLAYERLGNRIAATLGLSQTEVKVYPQGSMRTQTTISPRGNQKFDLDIVVELQGIQYMLSPDSEGMFADFGKALEGNESVTGVPEGKRRCWRLQYPGKPFYFDVTPAVPDLARSTGASLKVRDPDTRWSPSNPEDFANWFCERADKRFGFQQRAYDAVIKANSEIRPLPEAQVGLDDILRRTIQLMKLHRDNLYWNAEDWRKDGQPISVIIVTLATKPSSACTARATMSSRRRSKWCLRSLRKCRITSTADQTGTVWRIPCFLKRTSQTGGITTMVCAHGSSNDGTSSLKRTWRHCFTSQVARPMSHGYEECSGVLA